MKDLHSRHWERAYWCVLFLCSYFFVTPHSRGEHHPVSEINIEVECPAYATVDSTFTINYILSYKGGEDVNIDFNPDLLENDYGEVRYFGKTNQKSSFTSLGNGIIIEAHEDTWSAKCRALKPGKFVSPPYMVIVGDQSLLDTLNVNPIRKTVRIDKPDRKSIKQKEKERKEFLKLTMSKNWILAWAEVDDLQYETNDTIHCKLSLLNKLDSPKSVLRTAFVDDSSIIIKDCDHIITWYDESVHDTIEHGGNKYEKIIFAEILIIPHKKGKIEIPKIIVYGDREIRNYDEEIDIFLQKSSRQETVPYKVYTKPYTIHVK